MSEIPEREPLREARGDGGPWENPNFSKAAPAARCCNAVRDGLHAVDSGQGGANYRK
jgi:hypothetical protein